MRNDKQIVSPTLASNPF